MRRGWKTPLSLLGLALAGGPLPALAKNCNSTGNLFFLGTSSSGSNSVWLSNTSQGSFRLDAAQGNTTVDTWTKDRSGLNVSISPFVSNGNGGTHKLYDNAGDCLLDTQNQKGGVVLPPHILLPPVRPPQIARPPIGKLFPSFLTPMLPGRVTPPIQPLPPETGITPTRPTVPGRVTPPIGTLPPETGITPTRPTVPGRVTPPIGTLPPETGITPTRPTVPGRVTPPIGTLPPETGITPTRPTVPGGVTPPIGTLPPETGITPTRPTVPGRVTPPIEVLPPDTGITPTRPTVPGRVTPPIGTLPPETGITPTRPTVPGSVTPPILTLPPGGGPDPLTPTVPGGVKPPIGTLPPVSVPGQATPTDRARQEGMIAPENDSRPLCTDPNADNSNRADCRELKPVCLPDRCAVPDMTEMEIAQADVPLTPGRDFGVQTDWNVWTDLRQLSSHDGRYGLDVSNTSRTATFGLDRRISSGIVAGLSLSLETSLTNGYNGFWNSQSTGGTIGPYVAFLLSPNWAIDASVAYSRLSNDIGIAVLNGTFGAQRLSGSVDIHGQYDLGVMNVRPKLSVTYARTFSDGYSLTAAIAGRNIEVQFPAATYDSGSFTASNEFNRVFVTSGGTQIMPYAEFGVQYDAIRPNDGLILTGSLTMATPSAWTVTARSGVRMLLSNAITLEAGAGYLSFGQPGLDVVEARVRASIAF
jgi:hypothetical protein